MTSRQRSRGEGALGCIFWLAILGIFVFIAVKAVPVKIASSTLHDFMVEQAKFAGNKVTNEQLRNRILRKARELDLPVTKKDVTVRKGGGKVTMQVKYTVPLDLLVTTYNWEFDYEVDRQVFII